ncbi:hypothetical protein SKAU_G00045060 [Synaphobranchus kaupii]|uniref:G-protein coupled receptors family 1 profile domain-containing protein n=1 Tax=Synaphobranchus kaupii TaxID=118154 RepID=A0A9Q1G2P6_SYNKA|nr:hypothetical protein SKAU_G00045060 [Synaphobranchus kaupii]
MDNVTNYEYGYVDEQFYQYEDNLTGKDDTLTGFQHFVVVTYSLVFFVGTVGNALVIYIMATKSRKQRLVDIFITHLAVADLLFLIMLPFWISSFSMGGFWPFGDFLCKFTSYVIAVNMFSSVFLLACMSLDRFMAVVLLQNTRKVRTKRNAHLGALLLWLTSLGLGAHAFVSRATAADGRCVDSAPSASGIALSLAVRVVGFLLPLAVIAACYSSVALKLRLHFRQMSRAGAGGRTQRSVRVGLWILALFATAWLPFNTLVTVHKLQEAGHLNLPLEASAGLAKALAFSTCLAFAHSCANPLLYLALDGHIRRRALGLLRRPHRQGSRRRRGRRSSSTSRPTDTLLQDMRETIEPAATLYPGPRLLQITKPSSAHETVSKDLPGETNYKLHHPWYEPQWSERSVNKPNVCRPAQVPSVQMNAVGQQPTEISKGMTRLSDVAGKENSKHGTEGSSSSLEGKRTPVLYIASQSANNVTAPTVLVDQTPFHPSRIHEYYCLSGSIQWSEGAWENVSSVKSKKGPCLPIQMSLRWQWLGMDVKGPLPATHDGHTYILTVMDFYSKWVEAYPMKSLSAAEVALNIHSLICQLGFPHQILSRMKKTFLKEVNLALRTHLDAEACSLVVYHRDTCTLDLLTRSCIDSMVSELVNEHQKSWDVQLPASLFSLRCREHPSTHYSPFYMLYCKEPCTDLSIAGDEPFMEDQLEDDATQPPSSTQGQDPELSNTAEHTSLLDMMDVEEVLVVQCEQCAEWDRIPREPEAQVQREDDVYTCVACREATQRREEPL